MRTALIVFSTLLILTTSGCGKGQLETGYKYTPLGSTTSQRRAYYSGPFSPEARQAQMEQVNQAGTRRPNPGF